MADAFNVVVVKRKDHKFLYLKYTCPITGQKFWKSSGETSESKARKKAGELQAELRAGQPGRASKGTWADFRKAYEEGKVFMLRERTADKVASMFNVVEDLMKPDNVRRITTEWLSTFQKRAIEAGKSAATVEGHCRHLKAAMNWAKEQGILSNVPKFPRLNKVRGAKQMKGRPITAEEFDRMLTAVGALWKTPEKATESAALKKHEQRESIKFLLNGLWLSGLRLGEALNLTWDQWADGIRVDMSGQFVKLLIPAESEKGGQDRTYPVTPDFAEFLRAVPEKKRRGFVFNPILYRGICRRIDTVSRAITSIGESAIVKVDEKPGKKPSDDRIPVWASAHDLRRAFGFRWSRKVSSMVLKELMRHSSVTTTEKFYVGINADETAALLEGLMPREVSPKTKISKSSEKGAT